MYFSEYHTGWRIMSNGKLFRIEKVNKEKTGWFLHKTKISWFPVDSQGEIPVDGAGFLIDDEVCLYGNREQAIQALSGFINKTKEKKQDENEKSWKLVKFKTFELDK